MALRVVTGFEFGTTAGWATGNVGNKIIDTIIGTPTITTSTPRTGTNCLEVSAAGLEAIEWDTNTLATTQTRQRAVFYVRFVTSLPAADSIIAFSGSAGTSVEIRFVASSSKFRVAFEAGGAGVTGDATAVVDTWHRVEIYHDLSTNPNTFDWWVDGVQQTQLSGAIAASTIANFCLGDPFTGSTYTARYDDVVIYTDTVAIPNELGGHKVILLSVDPADTVTLSGTAANFNTFTANGTLAAWDATVARNNTDEIPPTIGASADGWVQITLQTTNYVQSPMTTYTLGAGETVAGARMLVPGWATSATAATIGFRSWNGTTETTLLAAADPNFDNSTTAPAWVCKMLTLADIDTQTELDGLAIRAGFSGDATPDIGVHAIYVELAVAVAGAAPPLAAGEQLPAHLLLQLAARNQNQWQHAAVVIETFFGDAAVTQRTITTSTGAPGVVSGDAQTVQRAATADTTLKGGVGVGRPSIRPSVVATGLKQGVSGSTTVQRSTVADTGRKQATGAAVTLAHNISIATTAVPIGGPATAVTRNTSTATGKHGGIGATTTIGHNRTTTTGTRTGVGIGRSFTHPTTITTGTRTTTGAGRVSTQILTISTGGEVAAYTPIMVGMDGGLTSVGVLDDIGTTMGGVLDGGLTRVGLDQ